MPSSVATPQPGKMDFRTIFRRHRRLIGWSVGILALLIMAVDLSYTQFQQGRDEWLKVANTEAVVDAVRRNPDDPVLLQAAGFRLWQSGKVQEALPLARRAFALRPDVSANQLLMAYVLQGSGQPAEAAVLLESLCRAHPELTK